MTPVGTLDELLTPARAGDGAFTLDVPDGWQQGRGAFGGLVLAALARAADAAVADPARTLRTLTGELVGPVQPGRADLTTEVLRAGSGVTTVAVRLAQAGEVQAYAVVTLGKPRAAYDAPPRLPPPFEADARPWREVPAIPPGIGAMPAFARHVEMRPLGPPPFTSGNATADAAGWVRARAPGARRDAAYVVFLADAWWPAVLPTFAAPRPMATLAFTLSVVGTLDGLDPEAPLYHRGRGLVARDGYAVELRELWGEDGRLIALNQQTFVVAR